MAKDYGDIQRGDATSRLDKVVDNAARKFIGHLEKSSSVLNRPVGSKVISPARRREEYEATYRGNPAALAEALSTYMAQDGPISGARKWSDWVRKMTEATNGTASSG